MTRSTQPDVPKRRVSLALRLARHLKKTWVNWTAERCPSCGGPWSRRMNYGVPARMCDDPGCSAVWGLWSRIWTWLPWTGWTIRYDEGGYLRALWGFIRGGYTG